MPINGKDTYYEFFGLKNFEKDPLALKKAYRAMALKWHPDRHKEADKPHAENKMKQVNEIWRVLSNEKDRYDSYLRQKMGMQDEPLRAGADAFNWSFTGGTTSTAFDWETLARMHEAAMRQEVNEMRRKEIMGRIVNRLDRMSFEKLKKVEDLIIMFGGL